MAKAAKKRKAGRTPQPSPKSLMQRLAALQKEFEAQLQAQARK